MLTWPSAYHSGFNLGLNVTEAISFATENWIPFGRRAGWCECRGNSQPFNVVGLFGAEAGALPPKVPVRTTIPSSKVSKSRPTAPKPIVKPQPTNGSQIAAAAAVASPLPPSKIPTIEELSMYPMNVLQLHLKNLGLYTNRLKEESKSLRIANSQLLVLLADSVNKGYPQHIPTSLLEPPHRTPAPPALPAAETFRPAPPHLPLLPETVGQIMLSGSLLPRTHGRLSSHPRESTPPSQASPPSDSSHSSVRHVSQSVEPSPTLPSPSVVPSSTEGARITNDIAMESPTADSPNIDDVMDLQ